MFGGPIGGKEKPKQCHHRYIPAGHFYGFLKELKHLCDHGTFALEVDDKGYAPPVGDEKGHILLQCHDEKGHFLKGKQASPMRLSWCFRYANSKPADLEMHAQAVGLLEAEQVSDDDDSAEEEPDASVKKRAKPEEKSARGKTGKKLKRAKTALDDEELAQPSLIFPRGWNVSGVDKTVTAGDCEVYTSVWKLTDKNQKLERGFTCIVDQEDGTALEVLVLLVYKHNQAGRMFALCTDRTHNGTAAAAWASPAICSAPQLLKADARPSTPAVVPFSAMEIMASMATENCGRESVKYRNVWRSASAAARPRSRPRSQV